MLQRSIRFSTAAATAAARVRGMMQHQFVAAPLLSRSTARTQRPQQGTRLFQRPAASSSSSSATSVSPVLLLLLLLVGGGAALSAASRGPLEADADASAVLLLAEENESAKWEADESADDDAVSSVEEPDDPERYELRDPSGNAVLEFLRGRSRDEYEITLYQYQVCPFCCKVRAFLDYHRVPYRVVEVNPITKGELHFSPDYRKVPITRVGPDLQVNDSSAIITTLSHAVRPGRPQTDEELKWRRWVDARLVRVLPPNMYRTMREATEAFEYISEMNQFSLLQKYSAKYIGSTAMYGISKRLKKRYNIVDERQALYDLAHEWTRDALRNGQRTFHGGEEPDLADLAVYGVLSSIEGLQTFHDMLQNTDIGPWYERVKSAVGPPSRTN